MIGKTSLGRSQGYRNFATMMDAGIPTIESLQSIAQSLKGEERQNIELMVQKISRGSPLYAALAHLPPLDRAIVRVGETNGKLADVLRYLASYYEERNTIEKAMKAAATKPALLIASSLFLGDLPALVGSKITFAHYLLTSLGPLAVIAALSYFAFEYLRSTDGAFLLNLPWIGKKAEAFNLERFFLCVGLCFKAGCDLNTALDLASGMINSPNLRRAIQQAKGRFGKIGLAPALASTGAFRERQILELKTAEMSGTLDSAFERIRSDLRTENLATVQLFIDWLPRVIYFFATLYVVYGIISGFQHQMAETMKQIPD